MSRLFLTLTTLAAVAVTGCSSASSRWRQDAAAVLDGVGTEATDFGYRQEYESAFRTFAQGEQLLREDETVLADEYFRLALLKGDLLGEKLADQRASRSREERRGIWQDQCAPGTALDAQPSHAQRTSETSIQHSRPEKNRQLKNHALPTLYTVRRGETLPRIAAYPDVYNDHRLWVLIYRSNRDQIRNPAQIWPGQVLRIPRNLSREGIAEARRYSAEKPL